MHEEKKIAFKLKYDTSLAQAVELHVQSMHNRIKFVPECGTE